MTCLNSLINRIRKSKNPIAYWRKQGLKVGEECEIYSSADFGSEPYLIEIGNHVRINAKVSFVTHDGGVWVLRRYLKTERAEEIDLFGKIRVGNNVHIGTGTMIMPGVSIGNNVIIGCGAIVTKDIPDNSVAVGVPAKVIENLDTYSEKHKDDFFYTKQLTREEKKAYLEHHLLPIND